MAYQYKMVITNSAVIVNDYDEKSCLTLERNFEVWDPICHKSFPLGKYYDKTERCLYLPRGGDIEYYKRKLQTGLGLLDISTDIRRAHPFGYTTRLMMKKSPRNDKQKEALDFMLCKGKYSGNSRFSQFQVNLNTGVGKTYCATGVIQATGIRSIIITAQSGILDQWRERIQDYTNLPNSEVINLEGSQMLNRILDNRSSVMNKSVYLVTHSTLHYFGEEYGWDKVGAVFEKLGIGIKIYDEAHQNFSNLAMIDFFTNTWRTYYLTATPMRSSKDENRIYQIYMKNVPRIDLFDEEEDPHTKYISMKYNSNPTSADKKFCRNDFYGLNRINYVSYLMRNDRFWIMFDYIFSLIYKTGGRALFYIGTNEGIKKVYDHILFHYPELWADIGIYTSISVDKAEAKKKKYILTTTKSAGAGEDIAHLKYSVVLAEPFKSEILARQTLGRTRDDDTIYIELVDVGFSQLLNYYNYKKPIFLKYATECRNVNIDNMKIFNLNEETHQRSMERFKEAVKFNQIGPVEAVKFVDPKLKLRPAVYFLSGYENTKLGD